MKKRLINTIGSLILIISLNGCITVEKREDLGIVQDLEEQINLLKEQVNEKDLEITELTDTLNQEKEEKQVLYKAFNEQEKKMKDLTEKEQVQEKQPNLKKIKSYYFYVILIQTALKNAGFELGLIDGKLGKRTQTAIVNFKKANGLPENTRIDKKTWELLSEYLKTGSE